MKIGITFSDRHCRHLDLPVIPTLQLATKLGFSHIRLGAYWQDLEVAPGTYNWQPLLDQLHICEQAGQPVVITVGIKAPRWPEFYVPEWYRQYDFSDAAFQQVLLQYVRQLLGVIQHFHCITHWQVENEPFLSLQYAGKKRSIPATLLQQEIAVVRELDDRPCIVTTFGNHAAFDHSLSQVAEHSDVIGIDLYPKLFVRQLFGRSWYSGIQGLTTILPHKLRQQEKPIWIMELQAEPWEKDEAGYRAQQTGSMSIPQLQQNIRVAQQLPVQETLLWGYEYWVWRRKAFGDMSYLQTVVCAV